MSTRHSKLSKSILWVLTSLVLILAVKPPCSLAIGATLEDAVLKGDWKGVIRILEKDDKNANDPVARLIMAHACMVTNRDNEAFLLFHSVKESKDKEQWIQWTGSLLKKHPENPMALYLSADALSRQGKLKEAIDRLSKAISLKPDFSSAMALRGVLYFLTNSPDIAIVDLTSAAEIAPDNAYAHAVLGIYDVLIRAPEGALEQLNKAIQINPRFSLAYNGRGCAYFGMGEFDKAAWDFRTVMLLSPGLLSAHVNYGLAISAALKFMDSNIKGKPPGTTLKSITGRSSRLHIPDKLLKTDFSSIQPQGLYSLVTQYGINNVRTAMAADFANHIQRISTHTSSLNDKFSEIKAPWREPIRNTMQMHVAQDIDAAGSSAFLNKVPSSGWNRYRYAPPDLSSGEQQSQWAGQLRESARRDVIDWAKSNLAAPLKPEWFSNLETAFNIGKGLASRRGNTPAESLDRLKPLASLGGPMASFLVPLMKAYYGMVFDALGSINVSDQMNSIDNHYRSATMKPVSMPPEVAEKLAGRPLGYYISPKQSLFDMNALATKLNKEITAPDKRALIVSGDPFKATIMDQTLYRQGFTTRVIPPTGDILKEARNFGANGIVGIKLPEYNTQIEDIGSTMRRAQEEELKREEYARHTIEELKRRPELPPPHDGGGGPGGGGISRLPMTSPLKTYQAPPPTDWNWAKPFVPNYPGGAPGGVSMREIARAFVDKGNWPLLIDFGIGYR